MQNTSKITEKKFGDWTANYFFRKPVSIKGCKTRLYCNCTCICGKVKDVRADSLFDGSSKNCGCLRRNQIIKQNTTHGMVGTRIYRIWNNMKQRCNNPNATEYERYGGRGIKVCKEWEDDFNSFYEWAIKNGYSDNLTIERNDINKNYEPNNCKWITLQEQLKNTSRTVFITYKGVTKCAMDWCKELELHNNVVIRKYRKGLPIEEVLSRKSI